MPQTDPVLNCARVLLAVTKGWKPGDGNVSTLANARLMLGELVYALDGDGFPPPAPDDVANRPDMQDAWTSCMSAARAVRDDSGTARVPFGRYAVFWVADPANPGKLDDQAGLGQAWPFQPGSHVTRVSGPILDGTDARPKRLFFFDTIALDAAAGSTGNPSPGFWPRSTQQPNGPAAAAASPTAGAAKVVAVPGARPRLYWATALFFLWIISGLALSLSLTVTGDMVRHAAASFQSTAVAQKCVGDGAGSAQNQVKPTWASDCDAQWSRDWGGQRPAANGILDTIRSWLWLPSEPNGHLSLVIPFVSTMLSMLVLMMAAGLATKGLWFGVLIDDRNRMSLSRAQQVAWTILLLSGLTMMGWFNAAAISATAHGSATGWDLFPTMPAALWTALGVNLVATPYLSDLILNSKDPQRRAGPSGQSSGATQLVSELVRPARLDANSTPTEASWVDLITGETAGTDQQLDVSRVQHLIISGSLLTTYFMALTGVLGDVAGETIMASITTNKAVFSNMPGVGTTTFLGLLGISHASYLAFKGNAAEGAGSRGEAPAPKPASRT